MYVYIYIYLYTICIHIYMLPQYHKPPPYHRERKTFTTTPHGRWVGGPADAAPYIRGPTNRIQIMQEGRVAIFNLTFSKNLFIGRRPQFIKNIRPVGYRIYSKWINMPLFWVPSSSHLDPLPLVFVPRLSGEGG